MGVGLVRSLQPPDILWIHWRVYNSIANTSNRVLFLPPSDVYVRSFLYLLYTLIKLYYKHTHTQKKCISLKVNKSKVQRFLYFCVFPLNLYTIKWEYFKIGIEPIRAQI